MSEYERVRSTSVLIDERNDPLPITEYLRTKVDDAIKWTRSIHVFTERGGMMPAHMLPPGVEKQSMAEASELKRDALLQEINQYLRENGRPELNKELIERIKFEGSPANDRPPSGWSMN